jgi:nucleoside-diphosphate-sugar epimerase
VTIVVTGATGFIGSEVIKALSRLGERTLAVSGPRSTQLVKYHNVEWLAYDSDLEDLTRRVAQVSPTAVVHCANHYVLHHDAKDIDPMIDANIRMGALLLGALGDEGTHFVNLSTFFQRQGAEGTQPNSLYAATKQAFTEHSNIRVCDVTLFDTYGPGDRRAKLIPKLLKSALSGELVEILTPDAEMNLCFIEDVVAALAHIVARGITGEWSVRAAANCRVAEVVSEIEAVTNRKVVEKFGTGQPHASPRLDGPPVLNDWSPAWSLRMGIEACWKSQQVVE